MRAAEKSARNGEMAPAVLRLLGGFSLSGSNGASLELPTRKSALLLAYLAVPAGTVHAREKLADLLWPNVQEEQARGSLRHAVAAIRKALGNGAIESDREGIALQPGHARCDVDRLADVAAGSGEIDGAEIVALCRGEFMAGYAAAGEDHGDWLVFERTRCRNMALAAMERLIGLDFSSERLGLAVEHANALIALDPMREQSHRLLMQAYANSGERSKALQQFYKLKDLLSKELGVDPSPQTAALARAILETGAKPEASAPATHSVSKHAPLRAIEPQPGRLSIAVLPFDMLGGDQTMATIAEGFSSDLVAGLSRVADLSVVAWQSSHQMSGRVSEAAESARELAVQYAVAGAIRPTSIGFRITAQLIATATREWVWAERYDLPSSGIFAVQDEIVERILGSIDANVRQAERERALKRDLDDLGVWELYHRGMWHMFRFTPDDVAAAESLFEQAMARAPATAAPHAGLAYAALVRVNWYFADDLRQTVMTGMEHARKAVSLDPSDAHAQTVFGRLLSIAGDIARGKQHLMLALEANPNFAHAHYGMSRALFGEGQPEQALRHVDIAIRLSPKDPLLSMFLTMKAFCQFSLGDLDAAENTARRAASLQTRETWSRLALAVILQTNGKEKEARATIEDARAIQPRLSLSSFSSLVQSIDPSLRERVLLQLRNAGLE